jgi:hypothetical protein
VIALVTDEATGAETSLGCALRAEDKPYGCALTGSQGTGKCVGPDELVLLEGRLIRAAAAWAEYATSAVFNGEGWWSEPLRWPLTCALDDRGRIVQAPVRRLYRQRIREPGCRVTLSDGSRLTVTCRHRLLGPDGWVASVAEGDIVCVPRRLDWPGRRLPDELVELLAWQLTEGCERIGGHRRSRTGPGSRAERTITQADRSVLERVRGLAERVGELHGLRMNTLPIRRGTTCWALLSTPPTRATFSCGRATAGGPPAPTSGGSRASSCADEVWVSSAVWRLWACARQGLGPRGRKPWGFESLRPHSIGDAAFVRGPTLRNRVLGETLPAIPCRRRRHAVIGGKAGDPGLEPGTSGFGDRRFHQLS